MKRLLLLLPFLLVGCEVPPRPEVVPVQIGARAPESARFQVIELASFSDRIAYYGERKIYQIVDTATGREYFGVTGVGISEVGSHSNGKTSSTDER